MDDFDIRDVEQFLDDKLAPKHVKKAWKRILRQLEIGDTAHARVYELENVLEAVKNFRRLLDDL